MGFLSVLIQATLLNLKHFELAFIIYKNCMSLKERSSSHGNTQQNPYSPQLKNQTSLKPVFNDEKEQPLTFEISTQVNMDKEFPKPDLSKQRKRDKKKQYKKRKREREKDQEKSACEELHEIIAKIYAATLTYEDCKPQIEHCVRCLLTGQKFHIFLNQAIRIHVNHLQKQVWEYMQTIIHENPFQNGCQNSDFYLLIIQKLYSQFIKLHESSQQIQKIINLYMFMKEKTSTPFEYQLDRSTYKYFIQSDDTIKDLLKVCRSRIPNHFIKEILQLEQIMDMMDPDDQDYEDDDYYTQISTSIDEQEETDHKLTQKQKKRLKKLEYSTKNEDVVHRISSTYIDKTRRNGCKISNEWVQNLRSNFKDDQE